jgi:plastocyanin
MTTSLGHRATGSVLALALAGSVALAACGSSGGSSGSDSGGTVAPGTVVVDALDGNKYDMSEYDATAGNVDIELVSKSSIRHTLLVKDADGTIVDPKLDVSPGKTDNGSYELKAGSYTLFCDVPGHTNMKATLVVK